MEQPSQTEQIQNQPIIEPSPEPYREKPKSKLPTILLGIGVVLLGAIYSVLVTKPSKTTTLPATSTPTTFISPTLPQSQPDSALATNSAFLQIKQSATALSSEIAAFIVNDSSLNPPTLDLTLGLDSK